MPDAASILLITATFLAAGAVKGVIGLGLPTVSLGILAAVLDLPTAMALMVVPSLVTNVWQAAAGGNGRVLLARIWPFLLAATIAVPVGATALTRWNLSLLSALLGCLLIAYALLNLGQLRIAIPAHRELWAGPVLGLANGILTGMTGSFVVPGVMFLQAIGLPRDMLVQAMGMLFTVSTLALAIALQSNHLLTLDLGGVSLVAVVPAIIGMVVGQRVRRRISEARFRQVLFLAILALGAHIVVRALFTG